MAEFKEFVKQFNRMCYRYDNCSECPMENVSSPYTCWSWAFKEPEKAEEILMKWVKENPPITNRDKFKEVFGFDISDLFPLGMSRHTQNWLVMEYKEPKNV